jgi:hypothetical protein
MLVYEESITMCLYDLACDISLLSSSLNYRFQDTELRAIRSRPNLGNTMDKARPIQRRQKLNLCGP